MRQAHRRKIGFLDRFEVTSAALDVEDVLLVAEDIALADLDRGIAPAVQDQRGVAAEETRSVDPLGKIASKARGFLVVPEASHPIHRSCRSAAAVTRRGRVRS